MSPERLGYPASSGAGVQILGPDPLDEDALTRDSLKTAALAERAPAGRIVVATRHDSALARVALGARAAGRVMLPLDPASPAREVGPLLEGAGLLMLDPEPAQRWTLPPGAELRLIDPSARPSAWQRLMGRPADISSFPACLQRLSPKEARAPDPEETALLLTTSGTTGAPRLVPWTAGAVAAQVRILADALRLEPRSRLHNLLPLHHIDGLLMGLLVAEHVGCGLVRSPAPVVQHLGDVLDAVWRERVSHLVLTPSMLSLLLRSGEDLRELFDNRHFQMFVSTAAPLPEGLWRQIEAATGRPVVNVYGLTETGNVVFAGPDAPSRSPGTVGRPLGVELRIVDEAGAEVVPGEAGEIELRGPTVTRAPPEGQRPLRDGFYATGDRGRLDEAGNLVVLGRIKAMISVGGLKVEPLEVERALLEHPGVSDARVLSEPDPVWGERVAAQVVAPGLDEQALVAHLRSRLSEHKIPRVWRLADELRRGATGKPLARPEDPLEQRVLDVATAVFRAPRGSLSLASRAGEVPGWDSLGHLDLVEALERAFDVQIVGRELMRLRSLSDALALLEARGLG